MPATTKQSPTLEATAQLLREIEKLQRLYQKSPGLIAAPPTPTANEPSANEHEEQPGIFTSMWRKLLALVWNKYNPIKAWYKSHRATQERAAHAAKQEQLNRVCDQIALVSSTINVCNARQEYDESADYKKIRVILDNHTPIAQDIKYETKLRKHNSLQKKGQHILDIHDAEDARYAISTKRDDGIMLLLRYKYQDSMVLAYHDKKQLQHDSQWQPPRAIQELVKTMEDSGEAVKIRNKNYSRKGRKTAHAKSS